MTTLYCDHGLYGAAVVTANTTNANATLTVTAVTSGRLGLGAMISGTNIPANSFISALGTGRGGAGTYTMSINATGTATGTTITASMGGPALDPDWGVAQEGDGTAIGASTPATVSIDLSAATADAGDTISIMGATLTCVASGASTNQFNAGSGATLVSNLVTAINRTTNTSTITAQATGWTTPKVQDAVFARIGSPTTTLQIMTRAGSAQYNSSTVAQSGIAGVTGPWTFSGGVGGAWGYLFLPTTSFPSAIGASTYGLWASTGVLCGVQNAGDDVKIRAGKVLLNVVGYLIVSPQSTIGANGIVTHTIDDGTVWAADAPEPVVTVRNLTQNGAGFSNTSAGLDIIGKMYSETTSNLAFYAPTYAFYVKCGGGSRIANFIAISDSSAIILESAPSNYAGSAFENCYVKHNTTFEFLFLAPGNSYYHTAYKNITLDNGAASSANNGIFKINTASENDLEIVGLKCLNFVAGSRMLTESGTNVSVSRLRITNPEFGNVSVRSGFYTGLAYTTYKAWIAWHSTRGTRDLAVNTFEGSVGWNAALDQPTLGALLVDGVTPWSFRMLPTTTTGLLGRYRALTTPALSKINSLSSGARTFKVQILIDDTLLSTYSWDRRHVSLEVMYQTASGENVFLSSWEEASFSTGAGGWSKTTFSDGGTINYTSKELSVSTPSGKDLPEGAEVTAFVLVHSSVANNTQGIFVDPDVEIA